MDRNKSVKIWQWNINGYRNRKAVLQQLLRTIKKEEWPEAIVIQETHLEDSEKITLTGYRAYPRPPSARTGGKGTAQGICTFVRKGVTSIDGTEKLRMTDSAIEANMVEIVIKGRREHGRARKTTSIYITNVYSNPQHGNQRFRHLIQAAGNTAKGEGSEAIICGDFNAPHEELGYTRSTVKGRRLLEDAAKAGFELISDPAQPSRIGTSTVRDTTPDLAFVFLHHKGTAKWRNTGWNLGSDHFILETLIPTPHGTDTRRPKVARNITNWHKFREADLGEIEDVDRWSRELVEETKKATDTVVADNEEMVVDSRLAHLLEARRSMQKRWRRQRNNKTLRKRVAILGKEIEKYSRHLCMQQWFEACNMADGQLHRGGTWALLRSLMDNAKSKEHQRHRMSQIIHKATTQMGAENVRRVMNEKYIPSTEKVQHPEYTGTPNPILDRKIEEWEVRRATGALNCRSAPGPDGVTNKALRNLSDSAIAALTRFYNKCWEKGDIPGQWKTAKTVLLPKPNKPPGIENLRPISLTSCVGKVLEHVLNDRWQRFLETQGHYSDSMLGFRSHLGTQDALLLLQREVLDPVGGIPQKDNRAVLGLDLQSAFDRVRHSAILSSMVALGMGERSYNYVRSFLTGRTACLEVEGERWEKREGGSVGTPQGSVISPLLFNLIMIDVARELDKLCPKIRHCIYADDITIWATGGSDGDIEAGLQQAVNTIEKTLEGTGLKCAPQKSQLLIIPPPGRQRKKAAAEAERNITISTGDGMPIPHVDKIRVLGMHIDAHRTNGTAANQVVTKIGIATRLVRRIATRARGAREASLVRLLQAFAISHAAYVGAFHKWTAKEEARIDAAIRKAYTGALGLLNGTKTSALLSLGVHNTLSEISEAQRTAQLTRLGDTAAGRRILERVGLKSPRDGDYTVTPIDEQTLRKLIVYPLPRNMDPTNDEPRRAARARALLKLHGSEDGTVFVDTARTPGEKAFVAVVVSATRRTVINACSVRAVGAGQGEEVAIALALKTEGVRTILSDSKNAIRNFGRGAVCGAAASLLRDSVPASSVTLKWFPAHAGWDVYEHTVNCNEVANAAARDLAKCREVVNYAAGVARETTTSLEDEHQQLTSYREILEWYRERRRVFPPPHRDLTRREGVLLRQLQTENVLTPALAKHMCPELYEDDTCSLCNLDRATLAHVLWGCGKRGATDSVLPPPVKHCVGSEHPEEQLRAVRQLEAALALQKRKGDTPSCNRRPAT